MKQMLLLITLTISLSLCSLTERFKEAGPAEKGSSSPSPAGSSENGERVEKPAPTSAQIAAIANGQNANWDQQGMSWTVPANWQETTNDSKQLLWRSPGSWDAANLIVTISLMDQSFPPDSIKGFYDGAKTRSKNGEVDELKWLELDGVKGVQFREANPRKPDGIRRLQWLAYRKYAGQMQMVNIILSSSGKGFPQHQEEIYGVLYSTKLAH
jgi:hypothetical protein